MDDLIVLQKGALARRSAFVRSRRRSRLSLPVYRAVWSVAKGGRGGEAGGRGAATVETKRAEVRGVF